MLTGTNTFTCVIDLADRVGGLQEELEWGHTLRWAASMLQNWHSEDSIYGTPMLHSSVSQQHSNPTYKMHLYVLVTFGTMKAIPSTHEFHLYIVLFIILTVLATSRMLAADNWCIQCASVAWHVLQNTSKVASYRVAIKAVFTLQV